LKNTKKKNQQAEMKKNKSGEETVIIPAPPSLKVENIMWFIVAGINLISGVLSLTAGEYLKASSGFAISFLAVIVVQKNYVLARAMRTTRTVVQDFVAAVGAYNEECQKNEVLKNKILSHANAKETT